MFGIGSTELLLILIVALLVLGPKSLASTARSVGKVVGQFRRVSTDFQRTLNAEVALEEEKEKRDKAAKEVEADLQQQPAANATSKAGGKTVAQANGQSDSQAEGQTGTQGTSVAGGAVAATAAKPAGDANDEEDDMLAPPPGSPLDEALKKAAAEAANAAELMEPVTVETVQAATVDQPAQAVVAEQAAPEPDAQGRQATQNRA